VYKNRLLRRIFGRDEGKVTGKSKKENCDDHIKEDGKVGACHMYRRREKRTQFYSENMKGRAP
jgi:hypothetical protein